VIPHNRSIGLHGFNHAGRFFRVAKRHEYLVEHNFIENLIPRPPTISRKSPCLRTVALDHLGDALPAE